MSTIIPFPSEKRQLKRVAVDHEYLVFFQDGAPLGRLVNLHAQGLLMLVSKPLDSDQTHNIVIKLFEPIDDECSISLSIDGAWSQEATTEATYWVGAVIVACSQSSKKRLSKLLERLTPSQ